MTTIIAEQPAAAEDTSTVLRRAADLLDALPHHRINRTDLHQALLKAAPNSGTAQDALQALHQAARGDEWLTRWSYPKPRSQAATQLRAAAERNAAAVSRG